MVENIDMSLDDIIANNRRGRGRGRRGGRGGSRGGNRGGSSGRGRGGNRGRTGNRGGGGRPFRNSRQDNRTKPYARGSIGDKWEHDMYDGIPSSGGNRGLSTGTHLQISNLDFGVTEADIKELFSDFGNLKKATINYDASGRSHGTADVIFFRRDDALKAVKTYKGVPLDGRPMQIEVVSANIESSSRRDSSSSRGGRGRGSARGGRGGGNFRSGGSGGRGGLNRGGRGGRGRGGRGRGRGGQQDDTPSKDQLDKELDSYISQNE